MQLLNTLYVTTPESYLHLDNDTVRIEVDRETRLRVPLHHVGTVVCFGNVMLSTPLMHRLADSGIGLVLLDGNGRFKARLEGPVSGNVLLRQAQHERSRDSAFTLGIARCCVAGKIKNARQVLLRGAREAKDAADGASLGRSADDLAAALRALPGATNLDMLRGLEGEAARQYFSGLNRVVRLDARATFQMDGRTRRSDDIKRSMRIMLARGRLGRSRKGSYKVSTHGIPYVKTSGAYCSHGDNQTNGRRGRG